MAAGVLLAGWLARRQASRLEQLGWLLIFLSMNVGLLVGLYAFDGPLPTPEFAGEYMDHRLVGGFLRETPARNGQRHDRKSAEYGDVQGDAEVGGHGCRQDGVLEKINAVGIRIQDRGTFQNRRQALYRVERSAEKKDREDDEVHSRCEIVHGAGKRCGHHTDAGASE